MWSPRAKGGASEERLCPPPLWSQGCPSLLLVTAIENGGWGHPLGAFQALSDRTGCLGVRASLSPRSVPLWWTIPYVQE